MDAQMLKHRMTCWLRGLLVVISVVATWEAQAALPPTVDAVLPLAFEWRCCNDGNNINTSSPTPLGSCQIFAAQTSTKYNTITAVSYTPSSYYPNWGSCWFTSSYLDITYPAFNWGVARSVVCPTATPAYTFNPSTQMCERRLALIITLSGGSEVEPSNSLAPPPSAKTLPFIATVKNQSDGQPPTNPVQVHISLKVDPTSGGHDHGTSDRPRGGIAELDTCDTDGVCWSHLTDNGAVVFNFNASETSGTYTITAICDGCSNTESKAVNVKVSGLKTIPPSGLYALYEADGSVIGAVKDRHESNHYLTSTAANRLLAIAINYHHLYPKDPVLHLNDASLMWGGKFDIYGTWKGKHSEHQRGTVIDVRANTRTGAIPPDNFVNFIKLARFTGADPHLENQGTDIQHFHLRLLNRKE